MKCIFAIIMFLTVRTVADQVIAYDPRFDVVPNNVRDRVVIDITNTNTIEQPDYAPWMRLVRTPSLLDARYRIGVTITGTMQQARADLRALIEQQFPARARMEQRDAKHELREARDKIKGQGNTNQRLAALEVEVSRLAEIVEYLVEQSESFK